MVFANKMLKSTFQSRTDYFKFMASHLKIPPERHAVKPGRMRRQHDTRLDPRSVHLSISPIAARSWADHRRSSIPRSAAP